VALALLHYPVYDKNGQVVTTSVTNLDIHDIARSARTFGISRYYLVNPSPGQQQLVGRLLAHWLEGWGAAYNTKRKEALETVRLSSELGDVMEEVKSDWGFRPRLVVTGAAPRQGTISCSALRHEMETCEDFFLLIFGTGWGLAEEIFTAADFILDPIAGSGTYNHLSVRSAAAIYLDRLFGRDEG
jgi:hypothetical protein